MKVIAVLHFIIHLVCGAVAFAANTTMAERISFEINPAGIEEVFYKDDMRAFKVGEIETLPKGTRLYHWEKASESQVKKWNSEGKISQERMDKLLKTNGFAGGGYYVSLSPLDSNNYGSTVVIAELLQETKILRITAADNISNNNDLNEVMKTRGVYISSVRHTPTWLNVYTIEPLSKIRVGTEKDFSDMKIETLERPWSYKKFFETFPGLKNVEAWQSASSNMDNIFKNLKKPSEEERSAIDKIVATGSGNLVTDVFKKASAENISREAIAGAISGVRYTAIPHMFERLNSDPDPKKLSYALLKGMMSESGLIAAPSLRALMKSTLDASERTRVMQMYMELKQGKTGMYFDYILAEYQKTPGQWLPHPLCREVFK